MSTRDFLVELGTEELPPLALPELQAAFAEGVRKGLVDASLGFAALRSYAAPRRLAVLVEALATQQPVQDIRRRGPPANAAFDKDGKPTRAAAAFAESCGVAVESLERAREGKGEFLFFTGSKPGQPAALLLPGIVQAALDALPIPKRMRWGSSDAEFVRPVHWLVMLLGNEVVPARILDTDSGNSTRGHRFHAPQPLAIDAPAHYAALLRERGHVLADFAERRERIRSQVLQKATELGGRPVMSDALLDEVTALVEWPVAIAGRFEERFLALPREVLISTLQDHQRYFPVEDASGQLTPWFITASNIESRDPTRVREGNERVVRPRLSDAAFFWDQDRREPLAARIPALDAVTFQAKLGSVGEKSRRVQALAAYISTAPASARGASIGASEARVMRAAALAKCDLLSAMVGEFPELQGVMGAYYAAADGEDGEVATAIREHYLPRGAGDALPATPTGLTVALADKIDTLAGIFAIGQKPSGTKDPFGLRRAAIGSLRILLEKRLELDLRALVARSVAAQPVANPAAATEVLDYILERLRALFLDAGRGITTEMYDAVLASGSASPLDLDARLAALGAFLAQPEGASLAAANKRIANILKKSEPQVAAGAAASHEAGPVDAAALVEPPEKALHAAVEALRADVTAALARGDYAAALTRLAALRPAVDAFFDGVMVNDPDARLRGNRLALLGGVRALFAGVADLSKLPG
jgi:glycyl-tRNA synthetase beta chain